MISEDTPKNTWVFLWLFLPPAGSPQASSSPSVSLVGLLTPPCRVPLKDTLPKGGIWTTSTIFLALQNCGSIYRLVSTQNLTLPSATKQDKLYIQPCVLTLSGDESDFSPHIFYVRFSQGSSWSHLHLDWGEGEVLLMSSMSGEGRMSSTQTTLPLKKPYCQCI